MTAGIHFLSNLFVDPALERAYRDENAAAFRRNGRISIALGLLGYGITVLFEPLNMMRDSGLWVLDLTRAVTLTTGIIGLMATRTPATASAFLVDRWLPAFWLALTIDSLSNVCLDPTVVYDGRALLLTAVTCLGLGGFAGITAADFRWTAGLIGAMTGAYCLATLGGHLADADLLERANFVVLAVVGAIGVHAMGASMARSGRRAYAALTRERQLVARLDAARTAAEQAVRSKTRFIATMSHEFRTPLNAIVGMTELLAHTHLTPRQRHHVGLLSKAADHLTGLLGDILDMSRIETDRIGLDIQPFDLCEAVRDIGLLLAAEATAKGLMLEVVPALPSPCWCLGDALRLRQVLINLVSNAIRYTPHGGVTLRAWAADDPGTIHFTVDDTGPGIAPDRLATIFEPFVQGHVAQGGRDDGLGLGLAISHRLVALMGGRLSAENRTSAGCRFTFTATLPPADTAAAGDEPAAVSAPPDGDAPIRILLADDSPINRLLVEEHMRHLPVRVDAVADGAAAVERFAADTYAAVLLDIRMPVLNGREAARAMRRLEEKHGRTAVPIVALTAGVLDDERAAAQDAGITDILAKPLKRQTLLDALARHLPALAGAGKGNEGGSEAAVALILAHLPAGLAGLRLALEAGVNGDVADRAHRLYGEALLAGLGTVASHLKALETAAAAGGPSLTVLREVEAAVAGAAEAWALRPDGPTGERQAVAAGPPVRVLLTEDQDLVRDGIRALLDSNPSLIVVGEAADGLSCVRAVRRLQPDIAIVDLMLPRMAGSEAIATIKARAPQVKVVVLTGVATAEPILAALRAGAGGVVHKTAAREELFAAIMAVQAGARYFSRGLPLAIHEGNVEAATGDLSQRERQVLNMLVDGRRNREIADLLALSPKTVEKHRASLMRKLDVSSPGQLAACALRHGLIEGAAPQVDA
jgi:signal transduction histidine kinase/DNA-binding NarL/FixJ family response regulator